MTGFYLRLVRCRDAVIEECLPVGSRRSAAVPLHALASRTGALGILFTIQSRASRFRSFTREARHAQASFSPSTNASCIVESLLIYANKFCFMALLRRILLGAGGEEVD